MNRWLVTFTSLNTSGHHLYLSNVTAFTWTQLSPLDAAAAADACLDTGFSVLSRGAGEKPPT